MPMKKILVIGCPGSGKSTFARALQKTVNLPLVHLDMLYWNADRTTVPRSVFDERLRVVLAQETWIIDGNYSRTMEQRLQACDTVFFLDFSAEVCLNGIRARHGKPRSDMPWVERSDEIDEEFIAFVRDYNTTSRPKVLELLEKYRDKRVVVFRTRAEADAYLMTL